MTQKVLTTGIASGDEINYNFTKLFNKVGSNMSLDEYEVDKTGVNSSVRAISNFVADVGTGKANLPMAPGIYLIDSDYTIPSNINIVPEMGAVFYIASGVTLTVNGGIKAGKYQIFSGDGSVAGSPLISEIYPEWFGAMHDDSNDDSDASNKAFELTKTSTAMVTFNSQGIYKITKTLYIPISANVNFNNAKIKFYTGTYNGGYCIRVNTVTGTTQENSNAQMKLTYIKNLDAWNVTKTNVYKLLYVACYIKPNNIRSVYFHGTIEWYVDPDTDDDYIDYADLDNIQINAHQNHSEYAIDKPSNGDSVYMKFVHMTKFGDEASSELCIRLANCDGALLTNCINGSYKFENCESVSIQNAHQEFGELYIQNSNIVVRDSYLWKLPTGSNITIVDTQQDDDNAISHSTKLQNITFILKYEDNVYDNSDEDVDASLFKGTLILEDNYREVENTGKDYNRSFKCGISVLLGNETKVPYINTEILQTEIVTNKSISCLPNDENGFFVLHLVDNSVEGIPFQGALDEYFYSAGMIMDLTRMVGVIHSGEKSIDMITLAKSNKILMTRFGKEVFTRIYRGIVAGAYTSYVDIPFINTNSAVDNFDSVNGYKWETRSSSGIDTVNTAYSMQQIGDNVVVYGAEVPTVGTWKVGDRMVQVVPVVGQPKAWACTVAGTPGTWVSEGNL